MKHKKAAPRPREPGRPLRETPLRALRLARNLSALEVAEAAGITSSHLGNLERGAAPVGKFSAYGLARAYKVTEKIIAEASARTVEQFDRERAARQTQGG